MIVASSTIRGSGKISHAIASPDGQFLAVASVFPVLTNPPGRSAYSGQKLRYRLALHRRNERDAFAVCDALRQPINDISFHPYQPVIAIAAGSYDGGWLFEGQLLCWNWSTGRCWPLADNIPQVKQCDFNSAGDRIDLLCAPWDEEWGSDASEADAFDRLYPVSIAYTEDGAKACAAIDIEPAKAIARDQLRKPPTPQSMERRLSQWLGVDQLAQRGAIWDVAWLGDGELAAVHDDCHLEIHDLVGGNVVHLSGEGYGARILRMSPPIVHIAMRLLGAQPRSCLRVFRNGALTELAAFDGDYSFTSASNRRILGRLDRHRAGSATADLLIDLDPTQAQMQVRPMDLGHYDCFNHYIGVDGAPDLYLLQGTPPSSHRAKRLCRIPRAGAVESLWRLLPDDGSDASHALECLGCYVGDAIGPGIVVAGRHYDPDPRQCIQGFIYRKPTNRAGRELWRHTTTAAASAMVHIRSAGLLLAALLDGSVLVIDATSGALLKKAPATVKGIPTVIYAMDVRDADLAVGTFDGCIAVIPADRLLADRDVVELA